MSLTRKKEKAKPVTKKDIERLFGFLSRDLGLKYSHQGFKKCYGGNWYVDTYSFYNESGCFTIYELSERGEWAFYYTKKYSKKMEELLDELLDIYSVEREMWKDYSDAVEVANREIEKGVHKLLFFGEMFRAEWRAERIMLETLADVIRVQIQKHGSFFGVKVDS